MDDMDETMREMRRQLCRLEAQIDQFDRYVADEGRRGRSGTSSTGVLLDGVRGLARTARQVVEAEEPKAEEEGDDRVADAGRA